MHKIFLIILIFFNGVLFSSNTDETMEVKKKSLNQKSTSELITSNNVLKNNSIKIKLQKDGIYKISYDDIVNWGFENPKFIKIWGTPKKNLSKTVVDECSISLVELPLKYYLGTDNTFNSGDYVIFYGESPNSWNYSETDDVFYHTIDQYSDYSYYIITESNEKGKEIQTQNSIIEPHEATITTYDALQFHEKEAVKIANSDKETGRQWFQLMNEVEISFNFPNIIKNTDHTIITKALANKSTNYSLYINNSLFSNNELLYSGSNFANPTISRQIFRTNSDNINILYKNTGSNFSNTWLDYAEINARCNLIYNNNLIILRDKQSYKNNIIAKFDIVTNNNNINIWDITNPFNYKQQIHEQNNQIASFVQNTDLLRTYIIFTESDYISPEFVDIIPAQNLRSLTDINNIIIAHTDFHEECQRLVTLHESNNIKTRIVTQEAIFNEFSSGNPHPSAIRNFMKYLYDNGNNIMYLTLVGDGSYDNRNFDKETKKILTYQTEESLKEHESFVSDDFYALLELGEGEGRNSTLIGSLDIACGRLPVNDTEQLKILIDKIINYATNPKVKGNWRNTITFLADDQDAEWERSFVDNSESLADTILSNNQSMLIEKIYSDAYQQISTSAGQQYPDANKAISETIKKGSLVFNYNGHGSELRMGKEGFITSNSIKPWNNYNRLPFFITASCEISRYDNHKMLSLGEELLLHPKGGAIALLSTTRAVYDNQNYNLTSNIYKQLVTRNPNGTAKTFGQIAMESKNMVNDNSNKRKFTLLGDPALKIALPELDIIIDSINNTEIEAFNDTLKALSKFTISGHIQSYSSKEKMDIDGFVNFELFDKKQKITTLNNQGYDAIEFYIQKNTIVRGKMSVENGYFKGEYFIPKDISYFIGEGNFNLYFYNESVDGNGSYNNILIGGSNDSIIYDNEGPKLTLYMNDSTFIYGGTTNESPKLIAKVFDKNGINITGVSIGHDATATLNNDINNQTILNDFYEPDLNTYKSGTFNYQYYDIPEGEHEIVVKVWDGLNNSNEEKIKFFVSNSAKIALFHVLNYPNPLKTYTNFYFEHNQSDTELDVAIEIYNISGQKIKTIKTQFYTYGEKIEPIYWDGTSDNGSDIGRGIYIYKISITNERNEKTFASERMVVIK